MAATSTQSTGLLIDGDAAFLRVNSRKPAHALLPGEVAAATNIRFDEGKPRPRFGVVLEPWGKLASPPTFGGSAWSIVSISGHYAALIFDFVVGQRYFYEPGNAFQLTTAIGGLGEPSGITIPPGLFTATQTSYYLFGPAGQTITSSFTPYSGNTCAYARFSDPNGVDNAVLIMDDWRDGPGEDGGRGKAWRIVPNNVPQAISLNGHDVWSTCRLKQAHHSMIMARHGNERHYFSASAVDATNNRIQLNCAPAWNNGDLVLYQPEENSEIIPGPNANAKYYVRTDGSNRVTLHGTKANALAGTSAIDLGTALGKFYLERQADTPGPFGNGAPSLILQPTDTLTAFENGFRAVPTKVVVTTSDATVDTITAPSHRLLVGDGTTVVLSTDGTSTKYVRPISDHVLQLYDTQANALAGGATGLFDVTADSQTGTIVKTGAAALPMPPLRELLYYKGRIIGIVSNTRDTIIISDPFDFLHYSIFTGPVPANLGESGDAKWLLSLGEDALLIGKEMAILAITGLSGASSGWAMDDVTREYGGIAALAALNVGTDGWFASRKGLASVVRTVAGEKLGTARTVSADIPNDLIDIDWLHAHLMCAETWNNRLFWAVPIKGQETDSVRNNRVLVFNFLNQALSVSQEVIGDQIVGRVLDVSNAIDSWEGRWEGRTLEPYAFSKLTVGGEERLTFATPDGAVCWLTDGFVDYDGQISSSLTTRGYFGGAVVNTFKGQINWDTHNPSLTVKAKTAGYNEQTTILEDRTFDRTEYALDGISDYNPSTSTQEQFDAPHREDYSIAPEELLVGTLDAHQNKTQPIRLRMRDRAPQLIIENAQGSARINSVQLSAKLIGARGSQT